MVHGEYAISQSFKPWDELGSSPSGLLELYSLEPAYTSDDRTIVKEALEFALEFAQSPCKWVKAGFHAGPDGYDVWKLALESGRADGFGTAYNAAFWQESRMLAALVLEEAAERLGGLVAGELRETASRYGEAARELNAVAELFPFHTRRFEHIREAEAVRTASRAIANAGHAERKGLESLARIVRMLA
ncbi:hypothetical protein [Paenibacillus sp. GYB003]|uniref:hypothetical protein n=1 Tax=Paenibacillus sp. GYB003 TaxID=2994392 RepID=UPI002F96ADE4